MIDNSDSKELALISYSNNNTYTLYSLNKQMSAALCVSRIHSEYFCCYLARKVS